MYPMSEVLVFLGLAIWGAGMVQAARLRRRYRQKTGSDLYPLVEVADRYTERPWLWLVEAPRVLARVLRIGTTPHPDAELEQMRLWERRLYGAGLTLFFLGMAVFFISAIRTP